MGDNVRTVSLGMGILSLLAAVGAAAALWFFQPSARTTIPFQPSRTIQGASCEVLQRACPLVAEHAETVSAAAENDFLWFEQFFRRGLYIALIWGALNGATFLYIYLNGKRGRT